LFFKTQKFYNCEQNARCTDYRTSEQKFIGVGPMPDFEECANPSYSQPEKKDDKWPLEETYACHYAQN